MPGIFLGLKFQACVFFWVCNMKLRRSPPSCILQVPPLGHEHGKLLRPLAVPMDEDTSHKVQQMITVLQNEHHINEMTEKWLCQTPNPPRIPVFYTPTKIYKPTWETSGVSGPTEKFSAFVAVLLQPLAQQQKSYLKD